MELFSVTQEQHTKKVIEDYQQAINNVFKMLEHYCYIDSGIGYIHVTSIRQLHPGKHGHAKFIIRGIGDKEHILHIFCRYKIIK